MSEAKHLLTRAQKPAVIFVLKPKYFWEMEFVAFPSGNLLFSISLNEESHQNTFPNIYKKSRMKWSLSREKKKV